MQIKDLHFAYDNLLLFESFDFRSDNNFIIIQGYSGCGKSTLLKIISNNLAPKKVELITSFKKNCLVLQEDALFPWLDGVENITKFVNVTIEEIKEHILFKHIETFIYKKAFEMSFGQRRLIELFRAILYKPNILCLDEPFNYLDHKSRLILSNVLFKDGFVSDNCRIIMTTHYSSDIEELKDVKFQLFKFPEQIPINKLIEVG
jgi:ABC-type nitrate/sulfonate/bicarbonate transport system ATPase subunit